MFARKNGLSFGVDVGMCLEDSQYAAIFFLCLSIPLGVSSMSRVI